MLTFPENNLLLIKMLSILAKCSEAGNLKHPVVLSNFLLHMQVVLY